jgi:hypothetical protein
MADNTGCRACDELRDGSYRLIIQHGVRQVAIGYREVVQRDEGLWLH